MRYLSVCSGIEAATVAWHPLGWEAAAYSEIEKFPRAVLQHHYPEVPLHGDFTTIQGDEYGPVDLLVGGTPCQSFSVAGLRGGLDDPRGNLALGFLQLARRTRARWVVWENVPGVLSSDGGRDFGSILGGLAELGYGWAYRVLDAQFFGVAQRRRRVFVVGYLGDWRRAAAVLFERHGLSGHPAPRRETGQRPAPSISVGPSGGGGLGTDLDGGLIAPTLNANYGEQTGQDYANGLIAFGSKEYAQDAGDVSPPLRAMGSNKDHPNGGGQVAIAYSIMPQNSGKDYKARPVDVAQPIMAGGPVGGNQGDDFIVTPILDGAKGRSDNRGSRDGSALGEPGDPMFTLREGSAHAIAYAIQERAVCENPNAGPDGAGFRDDDAAYTLEARAVPQAVAYGLRSDAHRSGEAKTPSADAEGRAMPEIGGEVSNALRTPAGGASVPMVAFAENQRNEVRELAVAGALSSIRRGDAKNETLLSSSAIRRLTPRECERLQGFPDDYTLIPWRNGMAPDGPRCKALGNSMAVPCMSWIGQRIQAVEDHLASRARAA